jgi:hypothetical protein
MRTIELYRKHKAGQVSREKFLYEVRRDKNLPWVTNVTSYDDAVKILKNKGIISEAEITENYEVHYSDGIRQSKKFKDIKSAIAFAKELAATNKELQHVDVFKAGPNFNSTADTDAVVAWWGDGSFMDNKSKNDPKLASKKMSLEEENDQERDARRKEGDKEMDQTLLTFLKNLNAKSPTDHIAQKIKDQEAEMIKKYGSLNEVDNNVPTDPAVDRVNPYFLKRGVQMLLDKEKELTNDSYIKALNKAALMLQKNPHAFDEEMFANAKDVEKADDNLETEEVKKNNLINKDSQMKKMKGQNIDKANTKVSTKENKKGKPKGVQMMKEDALKDLYNSLKKKDLVNEDSHWKHNVGSEVHTPDGPGKVIEIVGGTFTVEMEDGSQKDYQFNTVQHFTEKSQEENILPAPERKLPDEDKPLDPSYKMNKDGERAISPKGLEFRIGDEAIAIDNDQKIKIGSFKQSQGRIKAGFSDGINYKYIDIDGLEKPAGDDPWAYFKGKPFGEAVKQYIAKHKDDKEKMGRLKTKLKELVKVKDKTGDIVKLAASSGEAQQFVNSQQPNIKSQLTITGK